ncbi:RDD family protein [Bowmanella pacifica]|uniref:RDD domain protein n=1 Tax=Bowmanella pacifica TaxID=502051 RepID=A0A917Z220_9ALTE|nr:RDD family protein [Bowmanella pacifica]GGO70811.1 RDD domain protein [Bowmanella pacifica]
MPSQAMTQQETREIITPYAFKVADELLGTPLAGPIRRGIALLLDLLLVAMLATVNSLILAALFCWMFWHASSRLHARSPEKRRSNLALRIASLFMLFIFATGLFEALSPDDNYSDDAEVTNYTATESLVLLALSTKHLTGIASLKDDVAAGVCKPALTCWQTAGESLVDDLVDAELSPETAKKLLSEFSQATSDILDKSARAQLEADLLALYDQKNPQPVATDKPQTADTKSEAKEETTPSQEIPSIDKSSTDYSVVNWVKGLAEDLGLGFGWAAFYFSVFTAWWQGQTPAKKLLGIRVIKLDGNGLNLWESFGRYGGYGAGVATGLLGFLQIYWDANRQAIQDKISETLVIDLRKPKVVLSEQQVATLEHQTQASN